MVTLTRFRYALAISLLTLAMLISVEFFAVLTGHGSARLIEVIRFFVAPGLMVICGLLMTSNIVASRRLKHLG